MLAEPEVRAREKHTISGAIFIRDGRTRGRKEMEVEEVERMEVRGMRDIMSSGHKSGSTGSR